VVRAPFEILEFTGRQSTTALKGRRQAGTKLHGRKRGTTKLSGAA
jgi:hypothetical protein